MATAAEAVSAVAGGSGGNSNGYGGGRQQQKLWGQATINKMWQAAAIAAETAALINSVDQTLQLMDGEFKSPLSFWHDDKGGGMGRVLREKLATWNLKI